MAEFQNCFQAAHADTDPPIKNVGCAASKRISPKRGQNLTASQRGQALTWTEASTLAHTITDSGSKVFKRERIKEKPQRAHVGVPISQSKRLTKHARIGFLASNSLAISEIL